MRKAVVPMLLVWLVAALPAHAGEQQDKMKSCNAEASEKQLKGDERKSFMKTCLSASASSSSVPATQQEKMKSCNAEAGQKQLKGDERKKFMSQCLSNKPAA